MAPNSEKLQQPADPAQCEVFDHAMALLARRWAGGIVRALLSGPQRFAELKTRVPGITDRMLSQRLKELQDEGLVRRTVHTDRSVRIEYALTDPGKDLTGVIDAIEAWAHRWLL